MKNDTDLNSKSVKNARELAVNSSVETVVCYPNLEIEKLSKGTVSRGNTRKRVKDLKKELELRSMKPLTSYFEKKSQNLQSTDEGESKPYVVRKHQSEKF